MNDNAPREGMDLVAKTIAGWLKGFILLFGIYLVLHSHASPGGGFAGGIIIACSFILYTLAEGQRTGLRLLGKSAAAKLASAAGLLFLATAAVADAARKGLLGRLFPGTDFSCGMASLREHFIIVYDVSLALAVSMLIYVVFSVTAAVHVTVRDGTRKMYRTRR